jgi:hypothetical protein
LITRVERPRVMFDMWAPEDSLSRVHEEEVRSYDRHQNPSWDVVGVRSSPRKVQACQVWFNWSHCDPLISPPPPQYLHRVPGIELSIRPGFRARHKTHTMAYLSNGLSRMSGSRPTAWRLCQAQAQAKKLNREKPRYL